MRAVIIIVWLALPLRAQAATYSTPIVDLAADHSGKFVTGSFDFEQSFARIDGVSIEIVLDQDLPAGVCTGSSCRTVWTGVAIFDPARTFLIEDVTPNFSHSNDTLLSAALAGATPNEPSQVRLQQPNTRINLETGMFSSDPWPEFLFNGKASAAMWQVDIHSCHLNCSGSTQFLSAPTGHVAVRLIIEGIPVPEPPAVALG